MDYEDAGEEARKKTMTTQRREEAEALSTEVIYASFPKGTQQYPTPGSPAACSDCRDL